MQVKKQQLEMDMEQQTGSKLGRNALGCILSPCLFKLYVEDIMRNAGLDEAQPGIKISERNINNLRYDRWHHPYGRKWRGTTETLDETEREEWKPGLKLNI